MNITQLTVSCQRQKRIVIYKKTTINGLLTPNYTTYKQLQLELKKKWQEKASYLKTKSNITEE